VTDTQLRSQPQNDPRGTRTSGPIISSGTRTAGLIMLSVLIIAGVLDHLASSDRLGDAGDLVLVFLTLVPLGVAVLMLLVSRTLAAGPVRGQWTTLSLGILSAGVGNLIFIVLYLVTGTDPYPSVADVFTLMGYAFLAAGVAKAILAYRGLLDIRHAVIIASGFSVVALAVVYFTVIGPYVIFAPTETQSFATRVFNTIYPVLDITILLTPAIALGLLVSKLGAGRIAWPWWLVVASAATLALTDVVFAYAGYYGYGRTPFVDLGYAAAPLLLGFAALVARDIYRS